MLTNDIITNDLILEKAKVESLLPLEVKEYFFSDKNEVYEMHYPIISYPTKINSLSLEKTPSFKGVLIGVKGQYLLFDDGPVFNVRSSEGSIVSIDF
jgi:hypothetical protein